MVNIGFNRRTGKMWITCEKGFKIYPLAQKLWPKQNILSKSGQKLMIFFEFWSKT